MQYQISAEYADLIDECKSTTSELIALQDTYKEARELERQVSVVDCMVVRLKNSLESARLDSNLLEKRIHRNKIPRGLRCLIPNREAKVERLESRQQKLLVDIGQLLNELSTADSQLAILKGRLNNAWAAVDRKNLLISQCSDLYERVTSQLNAKEIMCLSQQLNELWCGAASPEQDGAAKNSNTSDTACSSSSDISKTVAMKHVSSSSSLASTAASSTD